MKMKSWWHYHHLTCSRTSVSRSPRLLSSVFRLFTQNVIFTLPMQILLTYPDDGLRLFQSMVPLGLLSIGTVVKEAGYTVRIIDFNHYHGNFRNDLLDWQPRIVGIGGTTPSRMKSFRIARQVKQALPGAVVVYGGVRYRPMEQVGLEIAYLLKRRKFNGIKVFDSTFTASRDHVLLFCETVRPFNLKWECEIRADTVDIELLRTMKEAGCYYVNMGLETSDDERLKKIAKGISTEQALKVLADCRELGILAKVFFTFGHPGQTFRECKQDIRFIRKHRKYIDFYAVTPGLKVYPGTRLEKEARKAGLISPDFSWVTSRPSLRNLILLEPSNTVILFQKGLGPLRLLQVALILLFSGLYSSREFMERMVKEFFKGLVRKVFPFYKTRSSVKGSPPSRG
ncbi:MAG: B12-binding domain-containing radical SAM protein [Bacteroidales bacterium]